MPLYTTTDEVGKHCLVFGRGTQRGTRRSSSAAKPTAGTPPPAMVFERLGRKPCVHQRQRRGDAGRFSVRDVRPRRQLERMRSFRRGIQRRDVHSKRQRGWQLAGIHYAVDGPFSNAVDGTEFEAALLERGGFAGQRLGVYRQNRAGPAEPAFIARAFPRTSPGSMASAAAAAPLRPPPVLTRRQPRGRGR